jgi:hypothetical protein
MQDAVRDTASSRLHASMQAKGDTMVIATPFSARARSVDTSNGLSGRHLAIGGGLIAGLGGGGFALGKVVGARNPLLLAGIGAAVGAAALGALLLGGNSSSPVNSQGDYDCPGGSCL